MNKRAHIIVFGNQKGGVGKTTLSVGVAGALALAEYDVLYVDADPQMSSSRQMLDHDLVTYARHEGGNLDGLLPYMQANFDYVIVDTPSGVNAALNSTLRVADLLIIPVKPSPYDFDSCSTTVEIAKQARVQTVGVVNEADGRTRLTKQAREALERFGIPVLKTVVGDRTAHREVVLHKKTITEVKINGGHAAREIVKLAREIQVVLGG